MCTSSGHDGGCVNHSEHLLVERNLLHIPQYFGSQKNRSAVEIYASKQHCSLQVILTSSGCEVNLHECATLLRHLSGGQAGAVGPSAIAAILHLPEPTLNSSFQQSSTIRPNSTRSRAGDLKNQLATVCSSRPSLIILSFCHK